MVPGRGAAVINETMTPNKSPTRLERRQTKIICTVGPASRSPEMLEGLISAGMDVARLHFSYDSHPRHAENIERIRSAAERAGRRVGILQDLSGSKIRMLSFSDDWVTLKEGTEFTLTSRKIQGDASGVTITVPELIAVVEPGDTVLLNDGALKLRAISKNDTDLRCEVVEGGKIKAQQSVHVPDKAPDVRVPTEKDRDDVSFALRQGLDWIALSYATTGSEVEALREFIRQQGADTPIVAKIERRAALDDLDDIIHAADAVMVARGDLGMEIPIEEIALVQKDIIRRANAAGKPVITATEMLTSMMEDVSPSRADVADITNAILDGSDAVMLSGETSVGKFPVEATQVAAKVALATDTQWPESLPREFRCPDHRSEPAVAVAHGACQTACALDAKLILCCTRHGQTARLISQQRPRIPILSASSDERTLRRTTLLRGVQPLLVPHAPDLDSLLHSARQAVREAKFVPAGGRIVIVARDANEAGHGTTDVIRVEIL